MLKVSCPISLAPSRFLAPFDMDASRMTDDPWRAASSASYRLKSSLAEANRIWFFDGFAGASGEADEVICRKLPSLFCMMAWAQPPRGFISFCTGAAASHQGPTPLLLFQ